MLNEDPNKEMDGNINYFKTLSINQLPINNNKKNEEEADEEEKEEKE